MKITIRMLMLILPFILPNIIFAMSIYNSDTTPHDIKVTDIRSGSQQIITVYDTSTVYLRCRYGCEIKVLETEDTITVNRESFDSSDTVVIDNGTLKLR
jgi:hypothetical protein